MRALGVGMFTMAFIGVSGYTLLQKEETTVTIIDRDPGTETVTITLSDSDTRSDLTRKLSEAFGWDEGLERRFIETHRAMQWDALNETLVKILPQKEEWVPEEVEVFKTHSAEYLEDETDILEGFVASSTYLIDPESTFAQVAEVFVAPLREVMSTSSILSTISSSSLDALDIYLDRKTEQLPDLVPIPPQDISLRSDGGGTLLVFSTIYYNQGGADLELRGDPENASFFGEDFERIVYQQIHRPDGGMLNKEVGTFLWHMGHQHYHFSDFVDYVLTPADEETAKEAGRTAQKSTFCIRDVSKVDIEVAERPAQYKICGRERQGITQGWGDAYFFTYPDQNLDVTDVPSGTYTLSFHVNPDGRLDEERTDNNSSSAKIYLDKEKMKIKILETSPKDLPLFEHIYVEQIFE